MKNEKNEYYEYFVRLGLWKFLEILLKENYLQYIDKGKFASFIWEVSSGSHFNRYDKSIIEKDWQQCWLATHIFTCLYKNVDYSDCEFLSGDSLEESINLLQKDLQFKSLADSLVVLNESAKKELSHLHTRICYSKFVGRVLPGLTTETINILKGNLVSNPGIAHLFINSLLCSSPSFDITNKQLLNIYKDLIYDCIEELKSNNGESVKDTESTLLSLITFADDKWSVINMNEYCKNLSALCHAGHIPLSRMLLSAASSNDLQLYLQLSKNEDNYHSRNLAPVKKLDRITLLKLHSELFDENIESLNISELFSRLIKNKIHWIEDVICLYAQLAMYGDLIVVDKCFQHPLLKKFQPLLVFQLWSYTSSMNQNQNNLNLICSILDCCKDDNSVLIQLSDTLEWLKFVIEWVDKEVERSIPDINTLLVPARKQSLLHLLKTMTDITRLNPYNVREFIKETHSKFSRDENVDKEIAIFDGFCILMTVLRSIFLAADTRKKDTNSKGCHFIKKLGPVDKILQKNLQNVKEEIDQLQPLYLRLEILENIFSMVFLRSEDLREDAGSDSGADDDDNTKNQSNSGKRFNRSLPIMTSSFGGIKRISLPSAFTQSLPPIVSNNKPELNDFKISKSLSALPEPRVISMSNLLSSEQDNKNKNSKVPVLERGEGFLCSNQLVSDLLNLVKDSVMKISEQKSAHLMENCDIDLRLKRLINAVDDGIWRLELLSRLDKVNLQAQNDYKSEWVYVASEGSDSDSELPSPRDKPATKRQRKSADSAEKSSESGSNTTGKGSSGGGGSNTKGRKTRQRKNSRKTTIPVSCSLINLMLASPRSLATHFLALNDVHSSSTIIKRFNLDDSTIATDVNFIISYKNLKKKLQNLQVQSVRSKSQNESTLEIINKAATAGFFTASVTREVEQFLSVTRLPDVGEAGSKALVALDLAVTLNASKSHSETLLGLAVKQCSAYTQNGGLAGTILEQFAILLNQHLQEEKVQNSIPDILRSPDIFMLTQKSKRQLMHVLWSSISIALSSFTAAIDAAHSSNAVVACSELAQIINNARSTWKGEKVDSKNGENYLHQLRAYVTLMSRITAPHISTGTPFSLLDRSLTDILQHLVFQCDVDPEDIEQMLQQLGIDLVFYLVQTCTPDVQILQPVKKPDIIVLNSLKSHEVNHENHPNIVVQRLLTSLISVLQTEGTDFGQKEATALIEKPSVQQVLQQTSFLADVDLSLISSSDESLVFLVNLMNLMWTHSLLTLETKGNGFGLLSKSNMLREVSCSTFGYNLGKFGFISLHQVNSALIRPILSSGYGFISWNSTSSLSVEPTWDPRILFALTSHYILSPKLQVLDVVDLDNQLEWCMSDYVRKSVTITDNSVILPSLLQSYLDYTTMTQGPESEDGMETLSNLSKERMACLTEFLKENPAFCQADITGKDIQITDTIGFQICIDYTRKSESSNINNKSISIMDEEWKNKKIEGSVLKYLTVRSPIVGMLVQKLHSIEEAVETLNDHEIHHYLENELNSDRINVLSCLFNENHVVTALQSFPDMDILWNWLDEKLMNNELEKCVEMITSLPEFLFCCEPKLSKFKDLLFFKLAGIKADGWLWCQKIKNIDLMAQGVMNYLHNWELNGALAALQTLLTQPGLNDDKLRKAKKFFSDISVCQNILVVYGNCDDWHKIYKSDCWIILEKLLDTKNIELALKWSQMHQIPSSDEEYENNWELIGRLILMLLETHIEITATEILTKLQKKVAIKICDFVISRAESLQTLRVVIDFLNNISDLPTEMKNNYILLDVGVNMLNEVPENDQQWYRPLISRPDLIVEQMLMCTQLSLLEKSLASVENKIANLPNDNLISRTNLDLLLRKYADKAVDIRVRRQLKPYTADVKSQQTSKVVFVPPDVPPNKDEWVPDDEVVECMSCQVAVFSMFNRRHHCRRCGRVVCSNCSGKTMKVVGYGNVPVRVCDDCFDYAAPKSAQLVHKKSDNDLRWLQGLMDKPDWVLKVDETYNSLIRNEFSYDNAPSISLCLSILKLHSLDTVQPKFLVAISESMLSLLRPPIPGVVNPELDHALLVQMIRSLILGAKVCYSGLGLPAGMAKCDQLLGEVDILNLLVTAHYVFLLPSFPLNNQLAIRNLRSSLLDQELWSLALEVSTKSGLEYGSVWFAWGKACLRGGAWKDAREKFSHCSLQKKDLQNAGMLADILQILLNEEGSSTLEARLGKLDTVINGKQKIMKFKEPTNTKLDAHVYKECMYYLSRYGSHSQNLDFLLTHGDIKQVLDYIRKTKIEPDYFVENVYLPCLRTGCIASLHQAMTSIDPKLLTWKVELKTLCAWCERREMFNVLYQVQLWLCDYVRASMTCIRFYHGGARCYSDLITNVQHLHTAISNLQTASNTQHSGSRNQVPIDNDLRMKLDKEDLNKHVNTIQLQIEVTEFLAKCDSCNRIAPVTLFGTDEDKINLAAKILITGASISDSLQLTERICKMYELSVRDVLCKATKQLALSERINDIRDLCNHFQDDSKLCDDFLLAALKHKSQNCDSLINRISDLSTKIQAYIECGLLKAAYLLASKHNRLEDVHKVLIAAESLNQPLIKKICLKRLNAEELPSSSSSST